MLQKLKVIHSQNLFPTSTMVQLLPLKGTLWRSTISVSMQKLRRMYGKRGFFEIFHYRAQGNPVVQRLRFLVTNAELAEDVYYQLTQVY
mgnify:CR=1 FL=1